MGEVKTSTITTATNNNAPSSSTKKEVDGKDLAISLAFTLFELGLTLTASYLFSKWIAKQFRQGPNGDGVADMDGFMADNGKAGESGKGVVGRLRKLLEARHEATLRAMMEELEDHQLSWKAAQEEKKEQIDEEEGFHNNNGQQIRNGEEVEEAQAMLQRVQTEQQYAQLQNELHEQHQQSLSSLSSLTPYEMNIAQGNVIDPSNISVTFGDVGGMDEIKSEIYDLVVLPLLRPDLFMSDSGLVSPPKGILLYGPPGTGKTMLAKAIAKESHATFVNVQLSTIMNKWFGESNKLISATFQLARKLAPSVVFIDEMDAFLSQRDGTEGSAVNSMKSEFLTLWDGLLSERKKKAVNNESEDGAEYETQQSPMLPTPPIIVLGATNRPYDVDPAILRRLPRSFEIPLPNLASRLQLLQLFLEKQDMTKSAKDFLPSLAQQTEGYSGSDLKEVCKAAAWEPVREMTTGASRRAVGCNNGAAGGGKEKGGRGAVLKRTSSGFPPRGAKARPVNEHDFLVATSKVKKTGESARQFHKKEFLRGREERAAMAADISKATSGNNGVAGGKDRGNQSTNKRGHGGKKQTPTKNGEVVIPNLDMQQIMAMAMAAASSMNSTVDDNTNGHDQQEEEAGYDDGGDDDVPPEMSGEATE
mmetsp:Transcript_25308/g.53458  ORF Transcript_25308/g.53458 Transcript_25308/m.53458 type:complete len:646 (-) Transcript_25308:61-1998(-)